MATSDNEFTYIFGEKEDLLLVLFQGKISTRTEAQFLECENELKTKPHKMVIFVFRDVSLFQPGPHVTFAKIQKSLRDQHKKIAVCSFRPEIKDMLLTLGIVREAEIYNNIPEAWNALKEKSEENAA